ncbi:MAG: hypothetical protein K0R09_2042 [Clostridiales bacterium]|jgi:FtsZ-binding cell division protein ZapB|nr:hypothetical protein [Clostridiales bacterium]
MNSRFLKFICLIVLLSISLSGCSNSLKDKNNSLKKELADIKGINSGLERTIEDLKNELEEEKHKNSTIKLASVKNKNNIYTIYTANIDTYKKEEASLVYIPGSMDLQQKITVIADVLSEGYFDNLPIKVEKIQEVNDKKIAVINLEESTENQGVKDDVKLKGKTWAVHYLQGSAGGSMTSTALIETLLQREHNGEWIDGVRFLYNNAPCDDHFQHAAALMQVNYRN